MLRWYGGMLRYTPILMLVACGSMTGPAPVIDRGGGASAQGSKPPVTPESGYVLKRGGGYYKDDGPGANPPADIAAIPDAVPKTEPLHRFANRPYTVLGQSYTPLREVGTYRDRGIASWYGRKFHGQKTSTGETYDMYAMTAAHPTLPLPSYARVTNLSSGKSVVVRVNDRGPFHAGRIIDLSYTAAAKLGLVGGGSGMVEVESLLPDDLPPATLVARSDETAAARTVAGKPLPEIADVGGPWLQLGAFANRDNAEALKSRLAVELGEMGEKLAVHASGEVFRVQIGPWTNTLEARRMADKIAELLELRPVLVHK